MPDTIYLFLTGKDYVTLQKRVASPLFIKLSVHFIKYMSYTKYKIFFEGMDKKLKIP